ncbi:hypothetical protein PFLG_01197 [Plasmodium falciparum RAJ116]|uniref:Uncharacterized protein n=1 Tax=Plasmodium falciparum RAJ116 TaxID=580058 RepID=A0A0L0CU34_PLAFA|nr:hypothetical protein PFLG_01197 [Plasmodium falciparum RAJ116]
MTYVNDYCAYKCYVGHEKKRVFGNSKYNNDDISDDSIKEEVRSIVNELNPESTMNLQQKYRNSNNNPIETLNSYPLRTKEQLNLTLVPNRVAYYHLSKKKVSKEVDAKYVRAKKKYEAKSGF